MIVLLSRRALVFCVVCCVRFVVASFPSRYWSIGFCGMESMNGGWLLVVGFGRLCFDPCSMMCLLVALGANDLCEL